MDFIFKSKHYVYISFALFLLTYLVIFGLGNYEVSDRANYLVMFELDFGDHYERGFRAMAISLDFLGLPANVSLYLLAASIFTLSYLTTWKLIGEPRLHFICFAVIFFGATSLYSIVQLRSGFAAWLGLLIYHQYIVTKNWKYLLLLPLTSFFHILMIAFTGIVFLYHLLRVPVWAILIALTSATLVLVFWPEFVLNSLGADVKYARYLTEARKNPIFFSPFIWAYFLISLALFCFLDKAKRKHVEVAFLGLPFAIIGFITSFDILPRFSIPFVVLAWIYFFQYIWKERVELFGPRIVGCLSGVLVLSSVFYAYYRH